MEVQSLLKNNLYPSVLIVAHEVINKTTSVGKTLYQYFSNWPVDKISELYFHSEIPTTHTCERYYRITDFDMLKSVIPFRNTGTIFEKEDIDENLVSARVDVGTEKLIYQAGSKKKPWMFTCRNLLWRLNTWKNRKLDSWIEEVKPEVIFFPTSDYTFPYEIVEYISKKFNIPVVTCVFDDYYYSAINKNTFLNKLNIHFLHKKIKCCMDNSSFILYNQPKMQRLYQKDFGKVPNDVFFMSTAISNAKEKDNNPIIISYFGSLGLGRHEAIFDIGNILKEITPDANIFIDVYSAESDANVLSLLVPENRIRFRGSISAKEVEEVVLNSNVLLLPESFNDRYLGRIEYALSTKVPDYLGSNRCILAYGPEAAGSIGYLKESGLDSVAVNIDDLKAILIKLIEDSGFRREMAQKQIELAKKNHSSKVNHEVLLKALST